MQAKLARSLNLLHKSLRYLLSSVGGPFVCGFWVLRRFRVSRLVIVNVAFEIYKDPQISCCASLSAANNSEKVKSIIEQSGDIFSNCWPLDSGIEYF